MVLIPPSKEDQIAKAIREFMRDHKHDSSIDMTSYDIAKRSGHTIREVSSYMKNNNYQSIIRPGFRCSVKWIPKEGDYA